MKRIIAAAALVLTVGCTSITTPDGAKYKNGLFDKQFAELEIEKKSGTNSLTVKIKGYKSDAQAIADTFNNGFNAGVNGLKVYTGQGATVQNNAPAISQDQLEDAIRRVLIRQSNSTVQTITEVKPK